MSLQYDTNWEVRTTGNDNNGGGFYDRNPGTSVDYTQQDSAQLSLTDLATDGAGTGLSSVTGGFTESMVGNIIHIVSGTGFTPGWYEIVTYTDEYNVIIDRSAGASASVGVGKVGGALTSLTDAFLEAVNDSNIIYIKSGTYNLTETINVSNAGSSANGDIRIEGYKTTRGDEPRGNDRPLVNCGSYSFIFNNFWNFKHIRVISAYTGSAIQVGTFGTFYNVYSNLTGGTNVYDAAIQGTTSLTIIDCELQSAKSCVYNSGYGIIRFSYLHDALYGVYNTDSTKRPFNFSYNIIANCSVDGFYVKIGYIYSATISNNTFYNCGIALNLEVYSTLIVNNIISDCGVGISNTATVLNFIDYNNFYNTPTPVVNVIQGLHDTTYDPKFTAPLTGDFSLQAASSCIGAGVTITNGVG